jgi:hypothetical protein
MTKRKNQAASQPASAAPAKHPQPDSKLAAIVEKLRGAHGATIADLQAITGWQEHSVRGALAGSLKKRFGLTIVSEKLERGRVYRAVEADAPA